MKWRSAWYNMLLMETKGMMVRRFMVRLLSFIGKQLWVFGSTRKGPPVLTPLSALIGTEEGGISKPVIAPVPKHWTISSGKRLRNPFLAAALAHDELGAWTLDAPTINFLEDQVSSLRPTVVLEFGSGISTLCFARFMQEQGHGDKPVVFSIEQNLSEVEQTQARLAHLGLSQLVEILHAPLKHQTIDGLETECYDLAPSALKRFLGEAQPDFVMVDGPAGDNIVRYGTLPLVRQHLAQHAVCFLDDALRPEELEVARLWSLLSYLDIFGIYRVGKGLLAGKMAAQHEQNLEDRHAPPDR